MKSGPYSNSSMPQILDMFKSLNPKPPYECQTMRQNPDLIKLQHEESPTFREDYEEYVMTSGQKVYQREILIGGDYYKDEESYGEIQILSKEEWDQLPLRSSSKLALFKKEINKKVWESRGNGIHHYQPWHEPVYYVDSMYEKISISQLEFQVPTFD